MTKRASTRRNRLSLPSLGVCVFASIWACGDDGAPADGHTPPSDAGLSDASNGSDAQIDGALDASNEGGATNDASTDAAMDGATDSDAEVDASIDAGDADASTPLTVPMLLSATGLYEPSSTTDVVSDAWEYTPRYALWSDGADKRRWLLLPEGSVIDTSNIDAFVFPVGTKAFKEFSLAGKRLETRMLWKTEDGWQLIAYAWNDAQTEATAVPRGDSDVLDTLHDIPQRAECRECHNGASDTLLGVSAIQLAHAGPGLTLDMLDSMDRLSDAPPADIARPDTPEWNALGYLHANCGSSCHNPAAMAYDRVDLDLALRIGELADFTQTKSYLTTVDEPLTDTNTAGSATFRIASGDSDNSGLILRMQSRGETISMPPLASEQPDDDGLDLVRDFIDSL